MPVCASFFVGPPGLEPATPLIMSPAFLDHFKDRYDSIWHTFLKTNYLTTGLAGQFIVDSYG